ncbi:hypothetical protein [Hymenobacter elongatus]|uniref:Uncharacterized protein n=1 Tax=Hymenobacter elongatus TaxID=877208 RepID=A0A4Z0PE28_9BACT|nr:hypothetical protein [Hymenobacter elongatus]TGE11901.1 hypothetical protein E5J99_20685 [Hymenobacter elongatus]
MLGQNPLLDFKAAVRDIRWRMKQGEVLTAPARPVGATGAARQHSVDRNRGNEELPAKLATLFSAAE